MIFDEIQALPRNCKVLFERAISFLTMQCHSTVVLCTATQLELNLPVSPVELMGDTASIHELHCALQRVTYCPQIDPLMDNEEASRRL